MLPATEETVLTAAGHEICGPGSLTAASRQTQRQREQHSQKKESQEEEEQEKEEEQEHSDAEDVGFTHRPVRVQVHPHIQAFKHSRVHVYACTFALSLTHSD